MFLLVSWLIICSLFSIVNNFFFGKNKRLNQQVFEYGAKPTNLRPDAIITLDFTWQETYAVGYCEVKASTAEKYHQGTHLSTVSQGVWNICLLGRSLTLACRGGPIATNAIRNTARNTDWRARWPQ